jgi:hypothetical protein
MAGGRTADTVKRFSRALEVTYVPALAGMPDSDVRDVYRCLHRHSCPVFRSPAPAENAEGDLTGFPASSAQGSGFAPVALVLFRPVLHRIAALCPPRAGVYGLSPRLPWSPKVPYARRTADHGCRRRLRGPLFRSKSLSCRPVLTGSNPAVMPDGSFPSVLPLASPLRVLAGYIGKSRTGSSWPFSWRPLGLWRCRQ